MGSSGRGSRAAYKDSLDFQDFIKQNLNALKTNIIDKGGTMDEVKDAWREMRLSEERMNLHELSVEDAISLVRGSISQNVLRGWFVDADSNYKPKLLDQIVANRGTLNAGLSIAYSNYKDSTDNPLPFNKWLTTPQIMYRGTHGQSVVKSDLFLSYTPDSKVAAGFGKSIDAIKVRPIDTLGSYQTTGEKEFLIPVGILKKLKKK